MSNRTPRLNALIGRVWRRSYRRKGFSPLPVICTGFAGLILIGSALLSLPIASATGVPVAWFDALFTSTSAVCVTGLVVVDTGTAYSTFGHLVLLLLIQLGGLGFMTFATLIIRLMGRHVTLRERLVIRDSMNEDMLGGMVQLLHRVAIIAVSIELIGALLLSIRTIPLYGFAKGAFYALFHSVSAFCNAGFDLFGGGRSLTGFCGDALINMTVIALVIAGGLGFAVESEVLKKRRFARFGLHTKIVLIAYALLMLTGFLSVLIFEWGNPETLGAMPVIQRPMAALFQSVTWRTAGFNTFDQQALHDITKLIGSFLMIVGASPASTGGGIKVTTLAVLFLTVRMTARGESRIRVFGRRIDNTLIARALTIAMLAGSVVLIDVIALSLMHPCADLLDLIYECASAMGTVGISAIGTANLHPIGRAMIIFTMFAGRVGPMTLALLLAQLNRKNREQIEFPEENVMIG